MKKKKTVHSAKKKYTSILTLYAFHGKEQNKFAIYRDNEIGVNEYWQAPLIESVNISLNFRKLMKMSRLIMNN